MAQVPRFVAGDERLYELVTPLDPAFIADEVERLGSVDAAAAAHQLDPELVQAAVDLARAPPEGTAIGGAQPAAGLTLVKDLLGLFGGIAVLVYVAGGVVHAARLSYEDLPWEGVFGQIPREFLISVGVGQVLLPALLVAAAYSLVRATVEAHRRRRSPITPQSAGDEKRFRELVVLAATIWGVALFGIVVFAARRRGGAPGGPDFAFWAVTIVGVVVLAFVFEALRRGKLPGLGHLVWGFPLVMAVVIGLSFLSTGEKEPGFWGVTAAALLLALGAAAVLTDLNRHGYFEWRPGPAWLTLALTYGFVAAVAATAVAATFPFLDARACTSTGFREDGALIGSGDRIFLGEPTTERRRIVSMPASEVEELFIGPDAHKALCDPRGTTAAVVATQRAGKAKGHRHNVDRQIGSMMEASTVSEARDPAEKLAASAITGGRDVLVIADAADSVETSFGGDALSTESRVVHAVGIEAIQAGHDLQRALNEKAVLDQLRALAAVAVRKTRIAATAARHLANRALNVARTAGE